MKKNLVKQLWRDGKATVGVWLMLGSPLVTEITASLGFDFIVVDTEHGSIDINTAQSMVQASLTTNAVPMVRVPWNDPMSIKRALDAGAYGIVVPMVNSREEAIRAVQAAKYPPTGIRSFGGPRAKLYGGVEYFEHANEEIAIIVQIEHIEAANQIDDILSVKGIDALFIGPADLAISMGLKPGSDQTDPEYIDAVDRVLAASKKFRIAPGIHVTSAEAAKQRIAQGFQFIGLSSDEAFLRNAASGALSQLNQRDGES